MVEMSFPAEGVSHTHVRNWSSENDGDATVASDDDDDDDGARSSVNEVTFVGQRKRRRRVDQPTGIKLAHPCGT